MSFHLKHKEIPFFISIATQRERHQSEKGQRKNLPEAIYCKDTPKGALKMFYVGMQAGQTLSITLDI